MYRYQRFGSGFRGTEEVFWIRIHRHVWIRETLLYSKFLMTETALGTDINTKNQVRSADTGNRC